MAREDPARGEPPGAGGGRVSLYINPDEVSAVLLADGWHEVAAGSFDLDSYEFGECDADGAPSLTIHSGGQSGVCATGFAFTTPEQDQVYGPLTAILAVRCR